MAATYGRVTPEPEADSVRLVFRLAFHLARSLAIGTGTQRKRKRSGTRCVVGRSVLADPAWRVSCDTSRRMLSPQQCCEGREERTMAQLSQPTHHANSCCGPGYASPREAMQAEREQILYTVALYGGTGIQAPDYLATVDVDPASPTYSQVVHRLPVSGLDDELHHFGWNACSSCHTDGSKARRFLIVPGFRSGRIHILDTADERAPSLHKVIEPEEVRAKTNLGAPHTVHCLADGQVMISMLSDGEG